MVKLSQFDVVVFDLDDTLYSENEYVYSGFKYLSSLLYKTYGVDTEKVFVDCWERNEKDSIEHIIRVFSLPSCIKEHLIMAYRYHTPQITLHEGVQEKLDLLASLNIPMYLITDGRSITQRLKVNALGLQNYFKKVLISEEVGVGKPALDSFEYIMKAEGDVNIVYIADNPKKDFIAPRQLGWSSLGILHAESRVHELINNYHDSADYWLDSFNDVKIKK